MERGLIKSIQATEIFDGMRVLYYNLNCYISKILDEDRIYLNKLEWDEFDEEIDFENDDQFSYGYPLSTPVKKNDLKLLVVESLDKEKVYYLDVELWGKAIHNSLVDEARIIYFKKIESWMENFNNKRDKDEVVYLINKENTIVDFNLPALNGVTGSILENGGYIIEINGKKGFSIDIIKDKIFQFAYEVASKKEERFYLNNHCLLKEEIEKWSQNNL